MVDIVGISNKSCFHSSIFTLKFKFKDHFFIINFRIQKKYQKSGFVKNLRKCLIKCLSKNNDPPFL